MATSGGGMGLLTVIMVSGGVLLLVLRRHKLLQLNFREPICHHLCNSPRRSCLSPANKDSREEKKRVHFAADVMEPRGNNVEYRRSCRSPPVTSNSAKKLEMHGHPIQQREVVKKTQTDIPANRAALYNGMLKYRVQQTVSLYY